MNLQQWQEKLGEAATSPQIQRRTLRILHCLIPGLAAFLLVLFLYAAIRRITFPFEVEWIESGILVSILRIVHGQGLYVAPTMQFVPFLYAPLYLYLVAAITKLTGLTAHGYLVMRLVSTLSTLGSCAVIAALVWTETARTETRRRWLPAIAAAGLYVGCYSQLDSFFDIGRVDSLFVFLLLTALLLQRRGHPIAAALMWVLVFQTKQTVLPLAAFILAAEWQRPKRAIAAVATFLVTVGASIFVLNHLTQGWYSFYVFLVSKGFSLLPRQAVLYWPQVIFEPFAAAWVLIFAALILSRIPLRSRVTMFYLFVSFALYGGIWFVEAHQGASRNSVMPVYAWTAVLFGVALSRLLNWSQDSSKSRESQAAQATTPRPPATAIILAAAALQLVTLIYNPGQYVPPRAAYDALNKTVEEIRSIPGDVFVQYHSYDGILAGKPPHAETEAFGAVLDAHAGATSARLRAELDDALKNHRYAAFVTDRIDPGSAPIEGYPVGVTAPAFGQRYLTSQPQWFLFPCGTAPEVIHAVQNSSTLSSPGTCTTK
jgi:Glycosyltransferase family 87